MHRHDLDSYGKSFTWRHDPSQLDEVSRDLYEGLIHKYYHNNWGESYYAKDVNVIYCDSGNIDDFYAMIKQYPDRFDGITLIDDPQRIRLVITEDEYDYLIHCSRDFRDDIIGKQNVYTFTDDQLIVYSGDPRGIFSKLMATFDESGEDLYIKKDAFSRFHRLVLDPIRNYVDISYEAAVTIENGEDQLEIYGDISEEDEALIEVIGRYGEEKINLLSHMEKPCSENSNFIIGYIREHMTDEDDQYFYGDLSRKKVTDFLQSGLPFLQNYADVYVSDTLKKIGKKTPFKVTLGVSLAGNLLEMDFSSLDIPKEELAQVMADFRKKKKFHRLRNGEMLHIESDELQELSNLMDQYHLVPKDLQDGHVELNSNRAYAVDLAANKAQHIKVNRSEAFKDVIDKLVNYQAVTHPLDEQYEEVLRDYQKAGYQWLSTLNDLNFGGILADDMGLGKTIQMITFLEHQPEHFTLVVCPASLILNWQDEMEKFSSKMRYVCIMGSASERELLIKHAEDYDVLITSYDYLRRDVKLYKPYTFDYVVIDEAQYIKNQTTKNAQSVKKINAKHHFALTGTPIENSLAELWSIFDFINKDYLYNYAYFKRTYESPIVRSKDQKKSDELKERISPFILRRRKSEVLSELPDKVEQTVNIEFSPDQRKLYYAHLAEANKQLQTLDSKRDRIQILAMLTRLRQICCEPRLISDQFKEPSNKMNACLEIIESYQSNGKKLLVFSSFKSILELIADELEKRKIRYHMLTGETDKTERKEMVDAFQSDDVSVFLISLKAGGVGLNLTAAEGVIHFDPWWNMSAQLQATDRTHRIGQDKTVFEYKLIMKDSIEEKILKLQEEKKNLADTFVEGNQGQITTMTSEEILSLFDDHQRSLVPRSSD